MGKVTSTGITFKLQLSLRLQVKMSICLMTRLILQGWGNPVLNGQIQAGFSILHAFTWGPISLGESIFSLVDINPA